MYSEKVMDHFSNPRNVGEISDANAVGQVGNPKCGDIMKIYMKINDDTKVIEDVKFKTFGCGAAIATSSMATELVKGKTIDEALELTNQAVADALDGLPPIKMHCLILQRKQFMLLLRTIMKDMEWIRLKYRSAQAVVLRAVLSMKAARIKLCQKRL